MSERILIPLDGSKLGETALVYVEGLISRMAPGEKVTVTLLHVITRLSHVLQVQGGGETVLVQYSEKEIAEMKGKASEYLNKIGEGLQSDKLTVVCKVSVNTSAADEIIKAEEELNADLVAMSTHGRSGISRFALGSIADKVMRGGTVPVLMVRASKALDGMR